MGSISDTSSPTAEPIEAERRHPEASGSPVELADGQTWLLANPVYQAIRGGLTRPVVDRSLDQFFERAVAHEGIGLAVVWEAARSLLLANYRLSECEVAALLSVAPGAESQSLAAGVVNALFRDDDDAKTYTSWVRASLIANGLGATPIEARDLLNVLAVLVATNRTIPLSRFADACRLSDERARLETLV